MLPYDMLGKGRKIKRKCNLFSSEVYQIVSKYLQMGNWNNFNVCPNEMFEQM